MSYQQPRRFVSDVSGSMPPELSASVVAKLAAWREAESDFDPAYDYDNEGEPPALPAGDGTWRLGNGWEDHGKTDGYFVAMTQGDYDWEEDAEYGELVGKWTDTETGTMHTDRVDWFPTRESAERAGRVWEQLAIWDIAAGEEIRL